MSETFALGFEDKLHEGLVTLVSGEPLGAFNLAMQVGSTPCRMIERREAEMSMAHAQGLDRVPTLLITAVEGFCKAFPAQEMLSFESSRARGDLSTAKLIRMVVSLDSALESMLGMEISELDGNPLSLAADFLETPAWSLGKSGAPNAAVVRANQGLIEVDGPSEMLDGFNQAAAKLNALCFPLHPFESIQIGGRAIFSYHPRMATGAMMGARLCSLSWMDDWIKMATPSIQSMAKAAGLSAPTMAGRLWMDSKDALSAKSASTLVEMSRWSPSMSVSGSSGLSAWARWKATPWDRALGLSVGVNVGIRLALSPSSEASALGMSTLVGLAKQGAATSVAAALESVLEREFDRLRFAGRLQEALSKVQRVALDHGAPGASEPRSRKPTL